MVFKQMGNDNITFEISFHFCTSHLKQNFKNSKPFWCQNVSTIISIGGVFIKNILKISFAHVGVQNREQESSVKEGWRHHAQVFKSLQGYIKTPCWWFWGPCCSPHLSEHPPPSTFWWRPCSCNRTPYLMAPLWSLLWPKQVRRELCIHTLQGLLCWSSHGMGELVLSQVHTEGENAVGTRAVVTVYLEPAISCWVLFCLLSCSWQVSKSEHDLQPQVELVHLEWSNCHLLPTDYTTTLRYRVREGGCGIPPPSLTLRVKELLPQPL